jgi:hypothetical protein
MYDLLPASLTLTTTQACACLARLRDEVAATTFSLGSFATLRVLLEALPLDTEEIAIVRNHLANAQMYAASKEFGAAGYELRLLARSLPR